MPTSIPVSFEGRADLGRMCDDDQKVPISRPRVVTLITGGAGWRSGALRVARMETSRAFETYDTPLVQEEV